MGARIPEMAMRGGYIKKIKKRGLQSRVYQKYQLIGLEIAALLEDEDHKTLYIKLAKERNPHALFKIAKDVAEKRGIQNKGAYFMSVIYPRGHERQIFSKKDKRLRRIKKDTEEK